jgi:hypothetical protein
MSASNGCDFAVDQLMWLWACWKPEALTLAFGTSIVLSNGFTLAT